MSTRGVRRAVASWSRALPRRLPSAPVRPAWRGAVGADDHPERSSAGDVYQTGGVGPATQRGTWSS